MNQIKIGRFIAECRKRQGLTQIRLANMLNITDRAVSKWERGKALPDSSIMLPLCDILKISVNDLLSGEIVEMYNYEEKYDTLLLQMVKEKEQADKKLLSLEILIGIFSMIILFGFVFTAAFVQMYDWLRICLIIAGFAIALVGIAFALKIEQTAGYYECTKCSHRYIPTFKSVFLAMHMGRTRYMKCPKCNKHSWQKKVIGKEN